MTTKELEAFIKSLSPAEKAYVLQDIVVTCKDCVFFKKYCEGYDGGRGSGFCSEGRRKPETPEKGRKVC